MWSDNETTEDLLGFQVHVDLIRSIVTDPKMLPATIGIFGDWGSGKTSVMKMLERTLDPENHPAGSEERQKYEKIACLYFNGWLFEGYDDAKSAILSSILLQLGEHKRFGPKIQDQVASLLKSVNYMSLVRSGLKSGAFSALAALVTGEDVAVTGLVSAAGSFIKEKEKTKSTSSGKTTADEEKKELKSDSEKLIKGDKIRSVHSDVRSFRDQFSELIAKCEIDSLIVLIDDLDRCSPERIIDNLEAIKLFLNVEQTAFVIGADPRIVRHAIATRYKPNEIQEPENQEDTWDRLVLDYLEKLIQIPYHLPRLSPAEVETYMVLLFCSRDLHEKDARRCLDAFGSLRIRDRYSVFGYTNVKDVIGEQGLPESLSRSLTFCATSAPSITEGLKGNPRQIKRFLNAFVLRKQFAEVAKLTHVRDEVLVKLMVLEYAHPEQYRQLYEWQAREDGSPKIINQMELTIPPLHGQVNKKKDSKEESKEEEALEIGEDWKTPSMKRWITMEPMLSDVDLRDYFWISRDRLQSTFSGISMVSPIVRGILEDLISNNKGKRSEAVKRTIDLNEDERISLLTQLEKHVPRNPKEKRGYDALHALIEGNIDGAAETFSRVLDKCPIKLIPASVAFMLTTLVNGKPELKTTLQPVIDRLIATKSRIASALKQRNLEI